jgi:hypothetical protein
MDNYGRNRRSWDRNSEPKDDYGRLWTLGSALQNRRVQVRFLSHLPPRTLNSSGLRPRSVQPILRALTPFDPNTGSIGSHMSDARPMSDSSRVSSANTTIIGATANVMSASSAAGQGRRFSGVYGARMSLVERAEVELHLREELHRLRHTESRLQPIASDKLGTFCPSS